VPIVCSILTFQLGPRKLYT